MTRDMFLKAVATRKQQVDEFLFAEGYSDRIFPEHLQRGICSYVKRGGKRLRPAVLMLCCGAAGGDEQRAVPAAAAVEIFHTWTLVHDDLIDNDSLRRGAQTVHEEARQWAVSEWGCNERAAREYGRNVCILSGDVQHGWAISLLLGSVSRGLLHADLAVALAHRLESHVLVQLIAGEMLDVQYSTASKQFLTEEEVLRMLWLKTGILYEFAGFAGGCIGEDRLPEQAELAESLATFCGQCGIAFQLQDDILGVTGTEETLGKPIGSDLREGKRTVIILHALQHASVAQHNLLTGVLGNRAASEADIAAVCQLLVDLGSVEHAADLAQHYLQAAFTALEQVPDSDCKDILRAWAHFIVQREC